MTRIRLIVALVAAAALLSGCATVPVSGPVVRVSAAPDRINPGVEIAPAPPGADATPSEVVEGFLHAMASWQPNYELARAYLTDEANRAWNPDAGVRVYAEGNPVVASEAGARLSAPVVGTLDSHGAYAQSTGMIDHDFDLVELPDGRWRINRPPDGLIISEYLFTSAFTRVVVYFPAPGGQWLVPDPRYFPRGSHAMEGAVRAALSDPTPWLAPGLDPHLPRVELESVHLDVEGVAHVTLTAGSAELSEEERHGLAGRLVWTLQPFETVTGVQVSRGTEPPWLLTGIGTVARIGSFPSLDPTDRQASHQLYAVVGGQVVRAIESPAGLDSLPTASGLHDVTYGAVRSDALQVAAVTGERTQLVVAPVAQPGARIVAEGSGLLRPNYSRQGELWALDGQGDLLAVLPDGTVAPVELPDRGRSRVVAFRLSPDGVRIALVIRGAEGRTTVAVGAIGRDGGLSVSGIRELSVSESTMAEREVRDVGWRSADTLLVLVSDARATSVMALAQDGSTLVPLGPTGTDALVELAVAPGAPAMVRTSDGLVLRYNADFRWSTQPSAATSIFYPG